MSDDSTSAATTYTEEVSGSTAESERTSHARPAERPVGSYAALSGIYSASVIAFIAAVRLTGRQLPDRLSYGDIALMGVATHKVSRRLSKDKVTSFLRAPFVESEEPTTAGEVLAEPVGCGPRRALGELLACPFCISQWVGTGFTYGQVFAPRATRLVTSLFTALTVADFLQYAYAATQQKVEG